LSRFIALLICVFLSACGFHLQGAASTPAEMQRTYISTPDEFSQFYRELRRTLIAAGVELTKSPEDATATLVNQALGAAIETAIQYFEEAR